MYTGSLELVRSPSTQPHRKHPNELQIIECEWLEHVEHSLRSYASNVKRKCFHLWVFGVEELYEAAIGIFRDLVRREARAYDGIRSRCDRYERSSGCWTKRTDVLVGREMCAAEVRRHIGSPLVVVVRLPYRAGMCGTDVRYNYIQLPKLLSNSKE